MFVQTRTLQLALSAAATMLLPLCAAAEPVVPDFSAADFSTAKPNRYFPLTTGHSTVMIGTGTEGGTAISELAVFTVLGVGPQIMGVQTVIAIDEAFAGPLLMERTFDYFAADAAGNVWYLGEDVENFQYDAAGVLTGSDTHSAWRAGVGDALPGIAMSAALTPATPLFSEHAPAEAAMDYATLVETGLTLTTSAGQFTDVIKFEERSMAEPDLREFKFYAPDIGLIRAEEGLNPAMTDPELVTELLHL